MQYTYNPRLDFAIERFIDSYGGEIAVDQFVEHVIAMK